jgi:hypothetical protein
VRRRFARCGPGLCDFVEQRLRRSAVRHGVGDAIGIALPAVSRAADVVGQAQAFALLHDVRGLVRGQVQRRRLAERDAVSRREGECAHPAIRVGRVASDARSHVRDVVPAKCRLNLLGMRQGKARIAQAAAGLAMNHARIAIGRLRGSLVFL